MTEDGTIVPISKQLSNNGSTNGDASKVNNFDNSKRYQSFIVTHPLTPQTINHWNFRRK